MNWVRRRKSGLIKKGGASNLNAPLQITGIFLVGREFAYIYFTQTIKEQDNCDLFSCVIMFLIFVCAGPPSKHFK